ncbi:MAG TPA: ABC-type transport auxiliary lipoprotein family protein [Xanthomonadaceae bacterium]|jgi:cholesterol transport system auxiliary component
MSAHRLVSLRLVAALAGTLALCSCSGILPKAEPMEILTPQVRVEPDPAWPQVRWQLSVGRPNANDMLESRRLSVIPTPGRIQFYKDVSWDDTVPEIVQSAIVEAFEDSGKIVAVGRQANGLRNDFSLQLDLRDDEAVYNTPGGPPEVVIVLNAKLVDSAHSRAVSSRTFRATATASTTNVHDVARAFDGALASLVHDLVGWTFANGQQARMEEPAVAPKR